MLNKIEVFDADFTGLIIKYLSGYTLEKETAYFTALLPNFIKTIAYALPFLIVFSFLKLNNPGSSLLTFILIIMLGIIVLSCFGVFLGFLQILY